MTREGERNPNSRLTRWQITAIRELYRMGMANQATLADWFGVTQSAVSRIVTGERWSHLRALPAPPAPAGGESPLALMDALVHRRGVEHDRD